MIYGRGAEVPDGLLEALHRAGEADAAACALGVERGRAAGRAGEVAALLAAAALAAVALVVIVCELEETDIVARQVSAC